ncbi:MAG: GNAT family N-acetyltransferase [Clostridia bacterium]|nr:GNAT family N-acetyltransferase [Clostridia bacterium]
MNHLGTQTIETGRLILRKARPEDAQAMFGNWASDDRVTKFMTWQTYTKPEEAEWRIAYLLNEYANDNFYEWFIELKEIGQPIGSIGAVHVKDDVQLAHIGYCIGSKWWGQGIMPEALAAVIKFFFEQVGVNRVEACHDVDNPNSGKVMAKCGMTYEGTLRQSGWNNQGINDRAFYGILREEYYSNNH